MTPEARLSLKRSVHELSRVRALAWIAAHGAPDCDHCGRFIANTLPGKRFCSTRCRTRHGDLGSHKYRGVAA